MDSLNEQQTEILVEVESEDAAAMAAIIASHEEESTEIDDSDVPHSDISE